MEKGKTVCFTGHRKVPKDDLARIQERLWEEIEKLVLKGMTWFVSGGALGFDTLAASTVIGLKQAYPEIKLVFALPCRQQSRFWSGQEKAIYQGLLGKADEVIYTSDNYFSGCMHVRNRFMVDKSAYCVCYLTEVTGGTAYTVRYAHEKGLKVISVAD